MDASHRELSIRCRGSAVDLLVCTQFLLLCDRIRQPIQLYVASASMHQEPACAAEQRVLFLIVWRMCELYAQDGECIFLSWFLKNAVEVQTSLVKIAKKSFWTRLGSEIQEIRLQLWCRGHSVTTSERAKDRRNYFCEENERISHMRWYLTQFAIGFLAHDGEFGRNMDLRWPSLRIYIIS